MGHRAAVTFASAALGSLLWVSAFSVGCERVPEEVAEAGAELETAGKEYILQPLRDGYRAKIKPQIEESLDSLGEIDRAGKEITQAANSINSTAKQTKETVGSVAASASETARSTGRTIKGYVRRAPRSQREANQLVEAKGRRYFQWIKERMNAFVERNQLRPRTRQDNGGRSP